jgi:hypothetical protein
MPGSLLGVVMLWALPDKEVALRIVTLIMLFLLARDAMTPVTLLSLPPFACCTP